jgi:hypothetical protein
MRTETFDDETGLFEKPSYEIEFELDVEAGEAIEIIDYDLIGDWIEQDQRFAEVPVTPEQDAVIRKTFLSKWDGNELFEEAELARADARRDGGY